MIDRSLRERNKNKSMYIENWGWDMESKCNKMDPIFTINIGRTVKGVLIVFISAFLCGCAEYKSMVEDVVETTAVKSAKAETVENDPEYIQYSSFVEDHKINQNGEYSFDIFKQEKSEDEPKVESHEGMIHVTFASNHYLEVSYWLDENRTVPIDGKECYLMPGQSIYASEPNISNTNSNLYQFAGYKIWNYFDGTRKEYFADSNTDAVFVAPEKNESYEYSIEPFGVYQSRRLGSLNAYYYDEKGEKRTIYGGWSVNGKPVSDEKALSATEDYTISFDYDRKEYYFVESEPSDSNHSDHLGKVTFTTVHALDNQPQYSVGLHHYVAVRIDYENKDGWWTSLLNWVTRASDDTGIISIKVNGEEIPLNNNLPKVKCGDVLAIETKPEYKVYCTQTAVNNPEIRSNSIVYTVTVPDPIGNEINIYTSTSEMVQYKERTIANATIKLKFADVLNSYEVNDGDYVKSGQSVTVIISPNPGYYLSGNKVGEDGKYTDTMTYDNYIKHIDSIIKNHAIKKYISVKLSEGDEFGRCEYTLNKQSISGIYNFKDGDKVTLTYTLTDPNYQFKKWGAGKKTSLSETVTIKSDMDGTELKRADYIDIKAK